LQEILDGRYSSATGLGIGIIGARRLVDRFDVESTPGEGACVTMTKSLPKRTPALAARELSRVAFELAKNAPQGLLDELQLQNQELLRTLQELRERQSEVTELHRRE